MLRIYSTLARHTLLETVRSRVLLLPILTTVAFVFVYLFIGELTLTDTALYRSTLTTFMLRITAVAITALIVIGSAIRDQHDKQHEIILAAAITRNHYYLGKLAGYSLISIIIAVITTIPLFFWADTPSAVLIWFISLSAELLLVAHLSLVLALIFAHFSAAALITAACYLLSRVLSTIAMITATPYFQNSVANRFAKGFFALLSYLIPDLGRYTQADWLFTPPALSTLFWLLLQTCVYSLVLCCVGMIDLNRKNL